MDTFYKIYIQVVFSVKRRQKLILPKFKEELNKYVTGIVRNKGHKLLAINGTRYHIHILLSINRDLHLSKLVNDIKTNSSKFINEKRFLRNRFEWQNGYGGSTYSHWEISNIIEYIHNQEKHHKQVSFEEEFKKFLDDNGIEYNPKYLFND